MSLPQKVSEWLERLVEHDLEVQENLKELLIGVLELDKSQLLLQRHRELTNQENQRVHQLWDEYLSSGYPVAYLLGYKDFYKYRFGVSESVLIPRHDTEILVEWALTKQFNAKQVADLGCGSGCIGLSYLMESSQSQLHLVDPSLAAIAVAQENAEAMGLSSRCGFVAKGVLDWSPEMKLDLILSNPPYIAFRDPELNEKVAQYEPHQALFADHEGLEHYISWTPWAFKNLNEGGWLAYESGYTQTQKVAEILSTVGFREIQILKDLSHLPRVILGRK